MLLEYTFLAWFDLDPLNIKSYTLVKIIFNARKTRPHKSFKVNLLEKIKFKI